jgi:hypothetical protein
VYSSASTAPGADSLSRISESLQKPVTVKCQRLIEALSAPATQPRATFYSAARLWLRVCIFVNSCDLAIDKWYLNRSKLLHAHVANLDAQQEEQKRKGKSKTCCCFTFKTCCFCGCCSPQNQGLVLPASDSRLQSTTEIQETQKYQQQCEVADADCSNSTHDHILLGTDGASGLSHQALSSPPPPASEHEMSSPITLSIDARPKVLASEIRMRQPREPWVLLWGNLHVSKAQQVFSSSFV